MQEEARWVLTHCVICSRETALMTFATWITLIRDMIHQLIDTLMPSLHNRVSWTDLIIYIYTAYSIVFLFVIWLSHGQMQLLPFSRLWSSSQNFAVIVDEQAEAPLVLQQVFKSYCKQEVSCNDLTHHLRPHLLAAIGYTNNDHGWSYCILQINQCYDLYDINF